MAVEVKINDRIAKVEILDQSGSIYKVSIDGKFYHFDVLRAEEGVYSVLSEGESVEMEMIEADRPNKYTVNTRNNSYDIEVIDAQARYRLAGKSGVSDDECVVSSPMPGKIVRVLVKLGEKVAKGDTLVVVSAMKMESEYNSPVDGKVKHVYVKPDDVVDGGLPLIEVEPD